MGSREFGRPARWAVGLAVGLACADTVLFVAPRLASAQGAPAEQAISSVEVSARPGLALPGMPVRLSGRTALDHATSRAVRIAVRLPDGKTADLPAQADEKGDFAAAFAGTDAAGEYRVEVISPGGKERGEAKFQVALPGRAEEAVGGEVDALIRAAGEAAATAEELVRALPISPPKEELLAKLEPLKRKLAERPAHAEKLKTALRDLGKAAEESPAFGAIAYRSVFERVLEWREEAAARRGRVEAELRRSKAASGRCDAADQAIEALGFLSVLMNFADRPFGILVGFATDYDARKIASIEKDPAKALVISSVVKALPNLLGGPVGWFKIAANVATDVSQYAAQQVFSKYCQRFAGPFTARMQAEFRNEGQVWWNYDMELAGRLNLRYANPEAPGAAVHLTGEFTGYLAGLKMEDRAIEVLYPKLARAARFFKRTHLPQVAGSAAGQAAGAAEADLRGGLGQAANALSPGGFNIPVEGELVEKKITLRLKPATQDLSALKARVSYVAFSVLSLAPVSNHYELPFKDAHHVLSAACGDPVELTVAVDPKKKAMTVERELKGTRGQQGGTAYGVYSVKLNLANPPG